MNELIKECNKAINNQIGKEFRAEARRIIKMTTDKHRLDFMKYHRNDQGNICCLVLDTAKRDLVIEGKLTQNDGDAFGKPFTL